MNSMVRMPASLIASLTYCMQGKTLELVKGIKKALPLKAWGPEFNPNDLKKSVSHNGVHL